MANRKIAMRLQTPPDANGDRVDIHPVTTTDEVIVDPDSPNALTLTEKLEQSEIKIQREQPAFPCIWARPVK